MGSFVSCQNDHKVLIQETYHDISWQCRLYIIANKIYTMTAATKHGESKCECTSGSKCMVHASILQQQRYSIWYKGALFCISNLG